MLLCLVHRPSDGSWSLVSAGVRDNDDNDKGVVLYWTGWKRQHEPRPEAEEGVVEPPRP